MRRLSRQFKKNKQHLKSASVFFLKVFCFFLTILQKQFSKTANLLPQVILRAKFGLAFLKQTIFMLGHSAEKTHDPNGSVLYFSSFALLPAFQGKKLAEPFLTGCLDSICGAFPQIKQIILLVNEEWHGAKHLYEKLGFKELRTIKDFFPSLKKSASDGIVMLKSVG